MCIWIRLSVRQKQPLAARGKGGIGGLIVFMIDIGDWYFGVGREFSSPASPISAVTE